MVKVRKMNINLVIVRDSRSDLHSASGTVEVKTSRILELSSR